MLQTERSIPDPSKAKPAISIYILASQEGSSEVYLFSQQKSSHHKVAVSIKSNA